VGRQNTFYFMTSTNARLEKLGRSATHAPNRERNHSVFTIKYVLCL